MMQQEMEEASKEREELKQRIHLLESDNEEVVTACFISFIQSLESYRLDCRTSARGLT